MKTNIRNLANGIRATEASTGSWQMKARRKRQKSALPEMHSMFETPFTAKRDCELLTPSILNRNTKYRQ